MNKNFWKNKKVLITGFEGFLGSHLTKMLLTTKAEVVGLDIKTYRKTTILLSSDYKRMKVYKGNVANYALVRKILQKHSIDVIFHLAAEAIVGASQQKPLRAFESNIKGTWTVLEAARQYGKIEALVVASSDKAYGCHKKLPYQEDMPLMANHPYDVSKSCADLIAYTYAHTYDLPVAITRCGNIFGPGDFNLSRIIPDAIKCALTGKTLLIRSDGKFTRDYVYVDDIANGYILLAEKLKKLDLGGEAFNFSDENPITVLDLVNSVSRILEKQIDYKILDQAKYEIKHQYLASHKARKVLGWRVQYRIEKGLRQTVMWMRCNIRERDGQK
ncbi:MAG TPA: GDP-mannose 4,6-dehydratase [Candidatus Omnitrophota bacterium]|nr:GDP-mannose 4,6-dehydratase [Candidatus Omnitrophota bacterium]